MKIMCLVFMIGLTFHSCKAQLQTWSSTRNWKLYPGEGQTVFQFPVDSLKNTRNTLLNQDSIQFYLEKMQPIPPERTPTWMGAYLASYESSDGRVNKVEVGAYGGYFYDVSSDKYFYLPRPFIRPWQKFITRNIPN
ncbi:MAG TPA: hypothetical protein VKQ52_12875 [Puia sp.]|nr:hypothetical protein [Puia sp.]